MNSFAQIFGGCLAYGIATGAGKDPHALLDGWQIISHLLGLMNVIVGIAFFFVLPDSPLSARFLTQDEKALHAQCLRGNQQGIGRRAFKKEQVWEALTDRNTWLYAFWVFAANVPNWIANLLWQYSRHRDGLFRYRKPSFSSCHLEHTKFLSFWA
jgi:hypothetical protein